MTDVSRRPGARKDQKKVVILFCPWSVDVCLQDSQDDAPINLRHGKCYSCTYFLISSVKCGFQTQAVGINVNMLTCRVKQKFLSSMSQQQGKSKQYGVRYAKFLPVTLP